MSATAIRLGISRCLLGEQVRFDGGHKRDAFLNDRLAGWVEWVSVCPEVELGLGVPRESLRLERPRGTPQARLVAPRSGADHTAPMRAWSGQRVAELAGAGLHGFVLKKGSPSCGMERVTIYGTGGVPNREGVGLFAEALLAGMPLLPVEEEGRLNDPVIRDHFLTRVHAYARLQALFGRDWAARELVEAHAREKLLLMAHSPGGQHALGRLVAEAGSAGDRGALGEAYLEGFMAALRTPAPRRRHVNVLQHLAGYFKRDLPHADRHELFEAIDAYRAGRVPRLVPLTLLRHHIRREGIGYLAGQTYLQPYPLELAAPESRSGLDA